jgi:hypothetical protein
LGVALESSLNHPRQILIQLDEALVLIATEMYFESGMVVEQWGKWCEAEFRFVVRGTDQALILMVLFDMKPDAVDVLLSQEAEVVALVWRREILVGETLYML